MRDHKDFSPLSSNSPSIDGSSLVDNFGRKINYLRLSVTDRCNFTCHYCRPRKGPGHGRNTKLLSFEELLFLAEVSISLGIEKIRITGGEPLLRPGLPDFLRRISNIQGLESLVLTTNGYHLGELAEELVDSGVQRVNISLDTLQPEKFAAITGGGELGKVLKSIDIAMKAGFEKVKLNSVIIKGVNEDEIADLAALTIKNPYDVRFIEYMPLYGMQRWKEQMVAGKTIVEAISSQYKLEDEPGDILEGVSREFSIAGGMGRVGVITPVSCNFCDNCNRIRVSSDGMVRNCLFASHGFNIRTALKKGDREFLKSALMQIVGAKPARNIIDMEKPSYISTSMLRLGG